MPTAPYDTTDWMLAASQLGDQSTAPPKYTADEMAKIDQINGELNKIGDPYAQRDALPGLLRGSFGNLTDEQFRKYTGAFSIKSKPVADIGKGFDIFDKIALPTFFALTGANALMAAMGAGAGSAAAAAPASGIDAATGIMTTLPEMTAAPLTAGQLLGTGATVGGVAGAGTGILATMPEITAPTLSASQLVGPITDPMLTGFGPMTAAAGTSGAIPTNGIINSATKVIDFLKEHPSSVKTIVEQLMPGNSGMSAEDWANLDEQERLRLEAEEAERAGNRNISGVNMRAGNVQPLTYRGSNQPVYTNGILNRRTGI